MIARTPPAPLTGDPRPPAGCLEGQAHHWLLPSPNGPTVHGVCRNCGSARDYSTFDDSIQGLFGLGNGTIAGFNQKSWNEGIGRVNQ